MKIQFDTDHKTIKVEGNVKLADLVAALESFLPDGKWKEYTLETSENSTLTITPNAPGYSIGDPMPSLNILCSSTDVVAGTFGKRFVSYSDGEETKYFTYRYEEPVVV
jgi:hypothetical protein